MMNPPNPDWSSPPVDFPPQRILIGTDAWTPQVNGVVRTMETTVRILQKQGHVVEIIEPNQYRGFPCPSYPEIQLCMPPGSRIAKIIDTFRPDRVHIATEGPIGLALRRICGMRGYRYTTSYHTKFPEYVRDLLKIPTRFGYQFMRWFHRYSDGLMVATNSLEQELIKHRFTMRMVRWSRGVDLELFRPQPKTLFDFPRPIMLYVGRISKEKSIEDFLVLKTPGTKVVVGDGPIRGQLEQQYPEVKFLGYQSGETLARTFANADLFVFPSRTDTFGLVQVEALACGVPVAAYPVVGPIDIIENEKVGALDENLGRAVERALALGDPAECVKLAQTYTWENCTQQFIENTVPMRA